MGGSIMKMDSNYEIISSVDLESQNMNVSLDIYNKTERDKNGNVFYQYRFVAEDEVTFQCIDIDLDDSIGIDGVAQTFLAADADKYEKRVKDVYSWGQVEFFFYKFKGQKTMTAIIYIGDIPNEINKGEGINTIQLEFDEKEIIKFKDFLFDTYQKMNIQQGNAPTAKSEMRIKFLESKGCSSAFCNLSRKDIKGEAYGLLQSNESRFSDQRNYVSELWYFDGMTNVTYFFAADGFKIEYMEKDGKCCSKELKESLIIYLENEEKIELYKPYVGITSFVVNEDLVYSVTITVGLEEEIYAEAWL